MPFINCDSAREELYQCLEQSDAATKASSGKCFYYSGLVTPNMSGVEICFVRLLRDVFRRTIYLSSKHGLLILLGPTLSPGDTGAPRRPVPLPMHCLKAGL